MSIMAEITMIRGLRKMNVTLPAFSFPKSALLVTKIDKSDFNTDYSYIAIKEI